MAVVVVDEAVLALTGYTLSDPLDEFYANEFSSIKSSSTHNYLLLTDKSFAIKAPKLSKSTENDGFITVMYFTGRVLRFAAGPDLAVVKLKEMIQERDGLPPATQRLLYNGKQLSDEGLLRDYGVPSGATINIVLRLFGGGGDEKVIFRRFFQYNNHCIRLIH